MRFCTTKRFEVVVQPRHVEALPGHAVGLLVSDATEVVGDEGQYSPKDVLWFSVGGASHDSVYWPCPNGQNDPTHANAISVYIDGKGGQKDFGECLLGHVGERKSVRHRARITLVEMEINVEDLEGQQTVTMSLSRQALKLYKILKNTHLIATKVRE